MTPLRKAPFRSAAPPPQERETGLRTDSEAELAGALPGQRTLIFKDRAALERFLAEMGDGLALLGRIDALNALHVGFLDPDELSRLLSDDMEAGLIFPAWLPDPGEGTIQAGAVGVGGQLLQLLGVTGDHSKWGSGVWVAVLDTGVSQHPTLAALIRSINLVPMSQDGTALNGHGTAVAGLIAGSDRLTPGLAPGLEGLLSIRIGDDNGYSNSRWIAEGIVAAVDSGVKVVNISFASPGDSSLVRAAVEYARENGVVIVAAAGNNGLDHLSYPAANDGVIAVGAVDATGSALDFSNGGNGLSAMTPGLAVNAPWTDGEAVLFTGTSASAPILAGAIAAAMSPGDDTWLSAPYAAELVLSKLNDAGAPGWDPVNGHGLLDMGRVMNAGVPGIHDAALAANHLDPPVTGRPYPMLQVVVENRGTEMLVNSTVSVNTPFGAQNVNITNLAPDQIHTVNVPLPGVDWNNPGTLTFDSSVQISGSNPDSNPANNRRVETYSRAE